MKSIPALLLLSALFLLASPHTVSALMSIGPVDKATAREWGIELSITESGPENAWLELTFPRTGKLKTFAHVSMELEEPGGKLLLGYMPLKEIEREGRVIVRFMAARSILDRMTLRIVTGDPGNHSGNDLAVKDYLPVKPAR